MGAVADKLCGMAPASAECDLRVRARAWSASERVTRASASFVNSCLEIAVGQRDDAFCLVSFVHGRPLCDFMCKSRSCC